MRCVRWESRIIRLGHLRQMGMCILGRVACEVERFLWRRGEIWQRRKEVRAYRVVRMGPGGLSNAVLLYHHFLNEGTRVLFLDQEWPYISPNYSTMHYKRR